jgi:hypothetical protein
MLVLMLMCVCVGFCLYSWVQLDLVPLNFPEITALLDPWLTAAAGETPSGDGQFGSFSPGLGAGSGAPASASTALAAAAASPTTTYFGGIALSSRGLGGSASPRLLGMPEMRVLGVQGSRNICALPFLGSLLAVCHPSV